MIGKILDHKGYTLVELIAVIGILVILSSVVVALLSTTLRGTSKSTITNDVSQNGDNALSIVSSAIVNSNKINRLIDTGPPYPPGNSLPVTISGGTFALSLIEVEDFNKALVSVECIPGATDTLRITRTGPAPTPAVIRDLISTTTTNIRILGSSCKINYIRSLSYDTPQVEIAFTIQQSGTQLFEKQAKADFKTRVTLRNY